MLLEFLFGDTGDSGRGATDMMILEHHGAHRIVNSEEEEKYRNSSQHGYEWFT